MSDTKQQCPQCGSTERNTRYFVAPTPLMNVEPYPTKVECWNPWHEQDAPSGGPMDSINVCAKHTTKLAESSDTCYICFVDSKAKPQSSPAVAPSGAREWLYSNGWSEEMHRGLKLSTSAPSVTALTADLLEAYAESLTAPLREQLEEWRNAAKWAAQQPSPKHEEINWKSRAEKAEVELAEYETDESITEAAFLREKQRAEAAERERKELAEASLKLCEWVPDSSKGSSGYVRKERVKALAGAALRGKEGE